MTAPKAKQAHQRTATAGHAPPRPTVTLGRLCHGSTTAAPVVDFEGNSLGPLRARTAVALEPPALERAIRTGQTITLVFEDGDPSLPIVTGLIQDDRPASPFQELLVTPRAASSATPADGPQAEAKLDGQRVVLEGKHEVVLKCGDASITLRRDGKVIVRGAYVETHARGVNRIKGGAVKIN